MWPVNRDMAPDFCLRSIQGPEIRLSDYRGRHHVILWFSRGFTCSCCRSYMQRIIDPYNLLADEGFEVLQVAPNLFDTAQRYFDPQLPYPFLCDPVKRLYAVYGLGDRGVMSAMGNTLVTFDHAFAHGQGAETVRASWLDMANRNFVSRLNHQALTAMDRAVIVIDRDGVIRSRTH